LFSDPLLLQNIEVAQTQGMQSQTVSKISLPSESKKKTTYHDQQIYTSLPNFTTRQNKAAI